MKQLLIYLAEVFVISGILYCYYHVLLRNKRFHQYNRFYLLLSCVLSLLIPFLNIPVYFSYGSEPGLVLDTLQVISADYNEPPGAVSTDLSAGTNNVFEIRHLVYMMYCAVGLFLLFRFLHALNSIRRLIRRHNVTLIGNIRFLGTTEPGTPFSFFRWLFWHNDIDMNSPRGEQIFRHELFHIRQRHSADILFMEILTVIFWINPFFHLIRKEITAIHEFLADKYAMGGSQDVAYAELLLMNAFNTKQKLINPFFHNQIKRRITMIINPKKTSFRYLRKLLVLPVAVVLTALFAFSYHKSAPADIAPAPYTVVIDAGHGGNDVGVVSSDKLHTESGLVLEIARLIQTLSPEYGIDVHLTRQNENLAGNASDKKAALKHSVELVINKKADLFISLHMSTAEESSKSGFEAYVSGRKNDGRNERLGGMLLNRLKELYTTETKVKKSNQGIYVLDHNTVPAVLLELGYMNNASDLAFVSDPANQEKLARQILQSMIDFRKQKPAAATLNLRATPVVKIDTVPAEKSKVVIKPRPDLSVINPLVVINDKVQSDKTYEQALSTVAPDDIAAVNIIRGEAATVKYGIKAVNGVVEITTKSANGSSITLRATEVEFRTDPSTLNEVVVVGYGDALEQDPVVRKVDVEAAFKGGVQAWSKFLERNLNSTVPVKNGAAEGRYSVIVEFVVDTEGKISSPRALTNHGFGMEAEVIRALQSGPDWLPALLDGKKVSSIRKQPVIFVVERKKTTV